MRLKSSAFSRYRPGLVTLLVLCIVAAPIVVANLSRDEIPPQMPQALPWPNPSYGWPLIWYECKFTPSSTPPGAGVNWRMNVDLVQWSGPRLAGNVAMWWVMLAVAGFACEWLLRRYFPRFHFRPRLVTLIVLVLVAAPIVLANLSQDELTPGGMGMWRFPSHGWPLIWRWRNCVVGYGTTTMHDWNFSAARLAGNLATWLVMLAAAGGACEWLLRRYRPRLRWSLRTMLAAVALLAVLCAWSKALRDRANVQDSIIATPGQGFHLYLERWGPKWLDLVGADRFRRRVVGVYLTNPLGFPSGRAPNDTDLELLKRLGRLPELRYLVVRDSALTPDTAAVLGEMWQLRMLRIEFSSADEDIAAACLASVGKLTRLERLRLDDCEVLRSDDLRCLRGLTCLRSLTLAGDLNEDAAHECLAAVGELTQLERLCLDGLGHVRSEDLAYLAGLTNLKSLALHSDWDEGTSDEWLAAICKLTQLERLCLEGGDIRSDKLAHLAALGNLRALGLRNHWTDWLADEEQMEEEEDSTEEDGESTDKPGNMDKPQLPANLQALPRLETIDLKCSEVGDADLARLAILPRLKLLNLTQTSVSDAGLAELASLESLEELAISNVIATAVGLESLHRLKRLKALHIGPPRLQDATIPLPFDADWVKMYMNGALYVREGEVDRCRQALEALRRSRPGIVIDDETDVFNERRAPKTASGIPENSLDSWVYDNFYGR